MPVIIDDHFEGVQGGMRHGALYGEFPVIFSGTVAVDGTASPFVDAPVGTVYVLNTGGTAAAFYFKEAAAGATADWKTKTNA